MPGAENVLISVRQDHAQNMLNGVKTAEVRRRRIRIEAGTRIWVYSKLPRGHVELVALAEKIVEGPPARLWRLYGPRMAITRSQFRAYCSGVTVGCVILLHGIRPLRPTVELAALRKISKSFHPPQFFKRLSAHSPEMHSLFRSSGSRRGKQPQDCSSRSDR